MKYALDANTVSFWVRGDITVADKIRSKIKKGNTIIIPPSTYYEVQRGFKHKSAPRKELVFSLICDSYGVGDMNLESWKEAADIYADSRKAGKPIEDSDVLLAAYCITNDCTLVTNNTKHFDNIDRLDIVDWSK